jgi:hypothetical protein
VFYRVWGRVLLVALVAVGSVVLQRAPATGQPTTAGQPAPAEPHYFGVASCSSMACHNFNGIKGTPRSEYSTWAAYDKHAKAFQVLSNDRSARIVKNLAGASKDIVAGKEATEQEYCLRCHATHTGDWDAREDRMRGTGEHFSVADGVGCESCHGPSDKYLTVHYEAGFKEKSAEEKAKVYGMWPTKSLTFRAQLCSTCHVGDETKEVNHDLIAAGHPRLNFELAAYDSIYNKHWLASEELSRHPDFHARIWLLGQLGSAKAALKLLADRAARADLGPEKSKPWPEFSEYACFACHKNLQVDSPRQEAGYGDRHPGSMPYGTWYLSALPPLTGHLGVQKQVDTEINKLKRSMEQPGPDAATVVKQANAAIKTLDGLIAGIQNGEKLDAGFCKQLMDRYTAEGLKPDLSPGGKGKLKRIEAMDWDEATQTYLSIAALTQALSDAGQPLSAPALNDLTLMKGRLRDAFGKGTDSPNYHPLGNPKLNLPSMADYLTSFRNHLGK